MLREILLSLNWVDLVMGCIFVRAIYIGVVKGIVVEIFKTFGTFFAAFVALHYFVEYGEKIHKHFAIPLVPSEVIAILLVWLAVTIIFTIARIGLVVIFKSDPVAVVDKTGGLLLALFRAGIVCSLVFVLFYLGGHAYIVKNADNSFSRSYLANLAPRFYENSYDYVFGRLFPDEAKNKQALKIIGATPKKKGKK